MKRRVGVERTMPRKTSSDDKEANDRIPPQGIPDDNVVHSERQDGPQRIPPNYEIPYSEVFLFWETEEIFLFNKRNYKV